MLYCTLLKSKSTKLIIKFDKRCKNSTKTGELFEKCLPLTQSLISLACVLYIDFNAVAD